MKRLIIIIALCLPTIAFAQQQPQPELILKITPPELELISDGLQTQPFGKVVPLMNKLRLQIQEQQKPPEKPVEAPK